jgi:hypothetical protein
VQQSLLVVGLRPAGGVQRQRNDEQRTERQRQRVLVEREPPASPADGSGSIRIFHVIPRILVLRGFRVRILRFRGSPLEQPGRQHDVHRHLEELALPVLEDRLDELPARDVGE